MEFKDYSTSQKTAVTLLVIGALVAVTIIILFLLSASISTNNPMNWTLMGQLGDSMAIVSMIWSVAAVFLVYDTLRLQRNQLTDAQDQFNIQLKESQSQFIQQQNKAEITFQLQQFEVIFFSLLEFHRKIAESRKFQGVIYAPFDKSRSHIFEGSEFFTRVAMDLKEKYQNSDKPLDAFLKEFFNTNHSELRPYFRSLYTLLKFIDRAVFLDMNAKKYYVDVIQSLTLDEELLLIFYNSVIFPTMLQLIQTYDVVRNLQKKLLLNSVHEFEYLLPLHD